MEENRIRTHIYTVPDQVLSHLEPVWERVCKALEGCPLHRIRKVVVTGCGYSYAAAMQARYLFEAISKIPAEAAYSVDVSRHFSLEVPAKETLVIGISGSGIVARVAEALERFRDAGAITLSFTGNPQSRCAKAAQYTVDLSSPPLVHSLPLRGYVMTVLGCYCVAWAIALKRQSGREADRKQFFTAVLHMAEELGRFLPGIEKQVRQFSEITVSCKAHEFVGSGMEYASAWLGRQQIIGQSGKCGIECSLEDWLHSDFFWNEPERIATMLFMPSNTAALSRAKEVQTYMLYLGRPLGVVTDRTEAVREGALTIILPFTGEYLLNPVMELIPVSLYAGQVTEMIGETYSRGFRGRWDFAEGGYATEFSEIEIIK